MAVSRIISKQPVYNLFLKKTWSGSHSPSKLQTKQLVLNKITISLWVL